jgi:L-lactate permease
MEIKSRFKFDLIQVSGIIFIIFLVTISISILFMLFKELYTTYNEGIKQKEQSALYIRELSMIRRLEYCQNHSKNPEMQFQVFEAIMKHIYKEKIERSKLNKLAEECEKTITKPLH